MTLRNRTLVDTLVDRALGTDASAGTTADATPEPGADSSTEQSEESA
jgi:hypothetical protein